MRNIIEFLYLYFCVYLIQVSIDDYLDTLLSGSSEPSSKAIKKLTKLLENFGAIMVTSTERMEDYITGLDSRISVIERNLGLSTGPAIASSAPARSPAPAATPTMAAPTMAAPNTSGPVGAPNVSSAPNISSAPNLSSAPAAAPAAAPAPSSGGGGISSSDLMKAAAGLQKAPEQQPKEMVDAASFSPSGVSVSAIQDVKAGLTKVDQDEHRKERAAATGISGSMPASVALNMEVKDALAKRKSRSKSADADDEDDEEDDFAPTQAAPAAPKRSTKQMKEALQGELRNAFSSLLESDTQEEED